ncbi:Nucleotidyl transferase of uncharacterised function (DUF2204) [Mycobacterium tuberculosis]|nr:Nucleotidyl transferase of uncharacterised function (DUF2204) [Mycobacterium tuberculosis]
MVGHHDEGPPTRQHAHLQDGHDVRVPGKAAHGPLLAQEALEIVPIQVGAQYLDGDGAVQRGLDAAVDDAESAAPDLLDIVESSLKQFRGNIRDQVPPRRVRINVGHRRSLSSAGRVSPPVSSPVTPHYRQAAASRLDTHRTQKLRSQTNGGKDRHQLTYEQFARMLTLMGPSDLWTVERAARHWGVSASRARAILSSRHIHRVSGYPAQAIKAVTLRQGARTDLKTANHLVPAAQAFTMAETGAAIGETEDERARLRIFFEFLRGADETGTSALDLIVDEPALIGEHRFDALLAAAAEYISARWGRPGPLWSVSIERFLDTAWWVSDLPSARAFAAVWTPAPFRRRGIYLDRHDLTSDGVCVMPEPVFNRTELQRAFTALAAKLERRGVVGQVHVVGGAAMLLAYNSRVTTRDIDALFSTDGPMLEAIREVADEMGWPRTWLNNQASGYVSRTPGEGAPVFDHPFLHVVATPAQHLLAMKVVAARGVRDGEDIRLLLDRLRITSAAGVWEIVARYFPAETITDRSRLLVQPIADH